MQLLDILSTLLVTVSLTCHVEAVAETTADSGSGEPTVEPRPPIVDNNITGIPEESTIQPKTPGDRTIEPETIEPETGPTTPFDINKMPTGAPEASTTEPHMPKPQPRPNDNETAPSEWSTDGWIGSTDNPEVASELPQKTVKPIHWTTPKNTQFTISQKMDENSTGYQNLCHMLEDLKSRRDKTSSDQTNLYISRASVSINSIERTFTNQALNNITLAQKYIEGLLDDASTKVRNGYSEIVTLTNQPSFYYIPKRQRYIMVNNIITGLGSAGELELLTMNDKAKTFCRNSNVDTPPYTLGNISGNKMGNGAILSK